MLYFISFGLIIVGIAVYSVKPPPVAPQQGDYREMLVDGSPAPEGHDGPQTYQQHGANGPNTPTQLTDISVTSPRYEVAKYTVTSPTMNNHTTTNNSSNNKHSDVSYEPCNEENRNCTEMLSNNETEHAINLRPDHPVTITDIRQESSAS